jgi:putative membrane protein
MCEWYEGMHWGISFGWIWMVLFWAAVIAIIIWVIKKLTERQTTSSDTTRSEKPLDIARERYAKGEITREEFEQLKKDLTK